MFAKTSCPLIHEEKRPTTALWAAAGSTRSIDYQRLLENIDPPSKHDLWDGWKNLPVFSTVIKSENESFCYKNYTVTLKTFKSYGHICFAEVNKSRITLQKVRSREG